MQQLNKDALKNSAAGMRLIALTTLYNQGDFARLRAYVREHYHPELLVAEPAGVWMSMFRLLHNEVGRFRVRQVVATDKYHVVVLMDAEHQDAIYLFDLMVEADHPHRIVQFGHQTLVQPS